MPEDPIMKFSNYQYREPNSVLIYADFEAYQDPVNIKVGDNSAYIRHQKPTGFGYIVVSPFEPFNQKPVIYRGQDASEKFIESLHYEYEKLENIESDVEMIYTAEDKKKL